MATLADEKEEKEEEPKSSHIWMACGWEILRLGAYIYFQLLEGKTVLGTNKKDPEIIVGSTSLKIRMF